MLFILPRTGKRIYKIAIMLPTCRKFSVFLINQRLLKEIEIVCDPNVRFGKPVIKGMSGLRHFGCVGKWVDD